MVMQSGAYKDSLSSCAIRGVCHGFAILLVLC